MMRKAADSTSLSTHSVVPPNAWAVEDLRWRVGNAFFSATEGVLFRPEGRPVVLRMQTAAVLEYFLKNPYRLIDKHTLLDRLWPGKVVTEDSLVQCIGEIRRALQDHDHKVLVTAPKRGYRLVPVLPDTDQSGVPPAQEIYSLSPHDRTNSFKQHLAGTVDKTGDPRAH